MSAPTTPVTIGTAGHIDHGKTLLVEKLTGMRADRPYERERGMTIDIGYAEMRAPDGRRVGFVDLPGHERFIRNMVAGATGIDLALLVIAADDGVMPQTREHVEILDLLGVNRGIVVLNKIDAVDEETRELALEELREFIADTGLKDAPVFACSAMTGEGVDAVRDQLLEFVAAVGTEADPGAFFLGVQRTFAAAGFGCIATGVPAAGATRVGDELELLPAKKKVRVRAIEIYHEAAEEAQAGHRTALNLAGIPKDQVERGMVVAQPGVYEPGRHIACELTFLATARRPLKHAAGVRFLTGTLEEMATVYLLEGDALRPGERALIEVRTRTAVPVRDGAPFILRSDNAKETLGGGRVVRALARPVGRKKRSRHEQLARWAAALDDPEARLRVALEELEIAPLAPLAARCQLSRDAARARLDAMIERGEVALLAVGYLLAERITAAVDGVRRALAALHAEHPLVAALPVADVRDRAGVGEALMGAALARLGDAVVVEARTVRLAAHSVEVDSELERSAAQLLGCLAEKRFAPPARDKLAAETGLDGAALGRTITYLRDRGALRDVAPGVAYTKDLLDEGLRLLHKIAAMRGSFEPVDAKAVLGGISRKWLIPLLEYYDKIGATRRDGNARHFTRRGATMAEQGIDAE